MERTQRFWIRRSSPVAMVIVALLLAGCLVVAALMAGDRDSWFARWFLPGESVQSATSVSDTRAGKLDSLNAPLQTLFAPRPIGRPFNTLPKISHVQVVDLDKDGWLDVVVCDCSQNAVTWIRQSSKGVYSERTLAENIAAPARSECVDFDQDGDIDVLVAVLGQLMPSNEHLGSVLALENLGGEVFVTHILLSAVPRVSDVRAADLDGDQKLDLVVTHFGYDQGEVRWMKNIGDWRFESHIIQNLAGGIHGIVSDMNNDGHLDIVVLVSQQWERIYIFEGDGKGAFSEREIYNAQNPDFGSAGIVVSDLDQDGDADVLYCNGDAFDYLPPRPWPWHGVQWLENQGNFRFRYHRLVDFGGAVCAQPCDYDGDGDVDILASSAFNDWSTPQSPSLLLLKNEGSMNYRVVRLANSPTHIQMLALGDLNADGLVDMVTCGMHISEPYDRVERVVLWSGIHGQQDSSEHSSR